MWGIRVSVRFVDADPQPGLVECRLVDAAGHEHRFIEKTAIVSAENLWVDTVYPRLGVIACTVVAEHGREPGIVTVDTNEPWGVESVEGTTRFDISRRYLLEF